MKKTKKSRKTTIDLADTLSPVTLAKLYYLCRERKLSFPDGVLFLIEEVSEPSCQARRGNQVRNGRTSNAKRSSCPKKVS